MPEEKRPLKVFLCHAKADKQKVRELYRYLRKRGIKPWLDEVDLIGGQDWQVEIPKAITTSDAIIICLTKNSVDKEGYIQKEIKFALDKALEMPEGRIFLIPVRFEECEVPFSLSRYQWVDLFDEAGYARMMRALKFRASQLELATVELPKKEIEEDKLVLGKATREKTKRVTAENLVKYPSARLKAMQEFMEFTRDPNWRPALIDISLFKKLGMAKGKEVLVIQTLRFLGVIDYAGIPTNEFDNLKRDYQATLKHLVQEKYSDLLSSIPLGKANQIQLINYFGTPFDTAEYQAKLFIWFCEQSGIALPKNDIKEEKLVLEKAAHAEKAQDESVEQDVVKKIAQINWKPTDALHDGKSYISIDITSEENRLVKCYSYIKSLELNGFVRDDIKNELVKHTNRVSWSGGSDEEVGIKNIDPKGFGRINLVSLNVEDFIRSFLQFESAKGPQFKNKDGNLLPLGSYIIDLGLSCSSNSVDFVDIPVKIGFEYIEEHDYFDDTRIISGRETRKVLRLLKTESSESVPEPKKPSEVITSKKDIKSIQEKRVFYDLSAHFECDIQKTTAETLANFLFESLTRIMRTVPSSDNNRTVEYQTGQVEYLDPKDGKTTQHALIVHGRKIQSVDKDDPQGNEHLAAAPEMLIITVTQGVKDSRLRFDSNELPNDAFKNLIEWVLADLGEAITIQIKDATPEKVSPSKQDHPEIEIPERQVESPDVNKHMPPAGLISSSRLNSSELFNINSNSVLKIGEVQKENHLPAGKNRSVGNSELANAGRIAREKPKSESDEKVEQGKNKRIVNEKMVPESAKRKKQEKTRRKPNTAIIIALIGFVGTICAAFIIALPTLSNLLLQTPEPTASLTPTLTTSTATYTMTPALTFTAKPPTKTPTKSATPTITSTPSIFGDWDFYRDSRCSGNFYGPNTFTIHPDKTVEMFWQNRNYKVILKLNEHWVRWTMGYVEIDGKWEGDKMTGTYTGDIGSGAGCWYAQRR